MSKEKVDIREGKLPYYPLYLELMYLELMKFSRFQSWQGLAMEIAETLWAQGWRQVDPKELCSDTTSVRVSLVIDVKE